MQSDDLKNLKELKRRHAVSIYDFNDVKQEVSIKRYLDERGMEVRNGDRFNATWRGGDSFSCSFSIQDGTWCDHGNGDKGGSVLDLCMKAEGLENVKHAATTLGDRFNLTPKSGSSSSTWREVAHYDYCDAVGKPLYCKVRLEGEKKGKHMKSFVFYRLNPDGSRGEKGMGDQPHVLYRLPEIIKAVKDDARILIVEGEKDADNLHALGLTATSSKEWQKNGEKFAQRFRGANHILVIADNDMKHSGHCHGEEYAVIVRDALSKVGVYARIAYVADGKDATDWIMTMRKDGLSDDAVRQKFLDLADNPPEWTWTPPETADAQAEAEALPPRFGEVSPDSANGEYSTFVGKVLMPDRRYYPFEVSAANDSLFAAILKAKKKVVGEYTERHSEESRFEVKASDLRDITPMSVVMWLRSIGCFYRNGETKLIEDLMFFNRRDGRFLRMNSDEFSAWVSNGARVNRADKEFSRLTAFLQDAGMDVDVSVETVPKAFVARIGNAVYVSNGESKMVRCSNGKCEIVGNGTDGVLFPTEHTLKEWELLPDSVQVRDPFVTTAQFRDLAYSTWYGQYLLRSWYLNLFACHAGHTPLLLTGERNSGKSATARAIFQMAGFPKREAGIDAKKEEDFWVSANGKGLLLFDNIEEEVQSAKWFCSALEKITTSGSKEVRKLFKQTNMNYLPNSDIIFSSKVPYYAANEGVAHRFVIVNLDANITEYKGDELLKEVLERRNESLTWMVRTIAKALVSTVDVPKNVNERYPDFGDFALRCASVLDDYDNTLKALQCGEFEKSRIVLVNDPEANHLYQFLLEHGGAWKGELMEVARWANGDAMPDGDREKHWEFLRSKAMRYASAVKRHRRPFEVCFKSVQTRSIHGRTSYEFGGLNDLLKGNL